MSEYAVYLDGEECAAYGRVMAGNIFDAVDAFRDIIEDKSSAGYRTAHGINDGEIDVYYQRDWQVTVVVMEVQE